MDIGSLGWLADTFHFRYPSRCQVDSLSIESRGKNQSLRVNLGSIGIFVLF